MDDVLLFSDDKNILHEWREAVIEFLRSLRLTIHESKAQPRPSETGVPFLGFQVFQNYRRLKPANGYAFQRQLRKMLQADGTDRGDLQSSLVGWINHASHGDTWNLRRSILSKAGIYGGNDG